MRGYWNCSEVIITPFDFRVRGIKDEGYKNLPIRTPELYEIIASELMNLTLKLAAR